MNSRINFKKFFSIILIFCMVVGIFAVSSFADTQDSSNTRYARTEISYNNVEFGYVVNKWKTIGSPTWTATDSGAIYSKVGPGEYWGSAHTDPNIPWSYSYNQGQNGWWGTGLIDPNSFNTTDLDMSFTVDQAGQLNEGVCFFVSENADGSLNGYFFNVSMHVACLGNTNYQFRLWKMTNYKLNKSFTAGNHSSSLGGMWCYPSTSFWNVGTSTNIGGEKSTCLAGWTLPYSQRTNVKYTVKASNGHIVITMNGKTVADVFDSTFTKGTYGFWGNNCEQVASMYISDFAATAIRTDIYEYMQKIMVRYEQTDGTYTDYEEVYNDWLTNGETAPAYVSQDSQIYKKVTVPSYTVSGPKTQYIDVPINKDAQVQIGCTDILYDESIPQTTTKKLTPKTYKYADTARGFDWGTTSPYEDYILVSDTQSKVVPESIPSSAFNISPEAIAKYDKVASFDSNAFSATDIYNKWTMYPNPNSTQIVGDYIVNDYTMAGGKSAHWGPNQVFLYSESKGSNAIEFETDLLNHHCCAPSGLVVNYNEDTDVGYVLLVGDANAYWDSVGGRNPDYMRDIILVRIDNFKYTFNRLLALGDYGSFIPYAANGIGKYTVLKRISTGSITHYHQAGAVAGNGNSSAWAPSWHHLKVTIDESGYMQFFVDNKLAIDWQFDKNDHSGQVGLMFQCTAWFKNINVTSKSNTMTVTNGLCINPNGGTYEGSDKTTVYVAGKGGSTIELAKPVREGYTFAGWATGSNFGGKLRLSGSTYSYTYKTTPNIDCIVARWIPNVTRYFINTYKVIYKDYNATGKDFLVYCKYNHDYNYFDNPDDSNSNIFVGWYNKENPSNLTDGLIPGKTPFRYEERVPGDTIYVYGKWHKTNLKDENNKDVLIETTQIQIDGSNIYKYPYDEKTWYVKSDTDFNLAFNGHMNGGITTSFKPIFVSGDMFEISPKQQTLVNDKTDNIGVLKVSPTNIGNKLVFTSHHEVERKLITNPKLNDNLLSYKQTFQMTGDNEKAEVVPHASATLTKSKYSSGSYESVYNSKTTTDKLHNIKLVSDITPPTVIVDEQYNNETVLITEKTKFEIKYADYVKDVDPLDPQYGSGVKGKNIKLTLTQEQTDNGGNPLIKTFDADTVSNIVKINPTGDYTGIIDITFNPQDFDDLAGFITIDLEISDNVGNVTTKQYRVLVMSLTANAYNTSASIHKGSTTFVKGEYGAIDIETNGFIDMVDIHFPEELDALAADEKSINGDFDESSQKSNVTIDVGRVLSDTYPRNESGVATTVLPQLQTKLWGTKHLGGMQYSASIPGYENCYLQHFFYAPTYSNDGRYEIVVTAYKTDPKTLQIYQIEKVLPIHIGVDASGNPLGDITHEFSDKIKDN